MTIIWKQWDIYLALITDAGIRQNVVIDRFDSQNIAY